MLDRAFGRRGLLILIVLLLVNVLNFVDRQLPFILVDALRADLKLTDAQIGLMTGVVFAFIYSFAALPLGRIADRFGSRTVLTVCLTFWSAMTAVSGFAHNFLHLMLARIGVAAGEAGTAPAAHALIARTYPEARRALVLSIFSLGVPIGGTLGLMLGGWINDVADWRTAFFFVGVPGILVAALAWFVLPSTGAAPAAHGHDLRFADTMRIMFRLKSFRHMAIAGCLFAIGGNAMGIFSPAFVMRTHGVSAMEVGLAFGLANGLGGLAGTFGGGLLADVLGQRDARWRQLVPALGLFLSAPTALAAFLVPDWITSVVLLGFSIGFGLFYYAPTFAAAQMLAPNQVRATVSAVLIFLLNLVGASVGPLGVGWVSDRLAPTYGELSLRYAMCLLAVTMLWSSVHFVIAARALPGDLKRRQAEDEALARGQTDPAAALGAAGA